MDVRSTTSAETQVHVEAPQQGLAGNLHLKLSRYALGESLIEVAGPEVLVVTWNESDGVESESYYALTRDGGETFEAVTATSYDLRLKYATFDPAIASLNVETQLLADASNKLHVVQFISPSMEEYREAIASSGGVIRGFLANHSHLVEIDPSSLAQLGSFPFVRSISPYHPAFKLEPFLYENLETLEQIVPLQAYNLMMAERGLAQKIAVADRIALLGGTTEAPGPGGFLLTATLTPEQLLTVITYDEVIYVDRVGEVELWMDAVREVTGVTYVSSIAGVPGYTGQGVRGMVIDQGMCVSHVAFAARPPTVLLGNSVFHDHGTPVYGIIFGDGSSAPAEHPELPIARGIMPDAEGIFMSYNDINWNSTRERCFACQNVFPWRDCLHLCGTGNIHAPFQAVFQSRSYGYNTGIDYGTRSADLDDVVFTYDMTICQAQGNCGNPEGRFGCSVPGFGGRVSPHEAWAKNVVSVGAVYHAQRIGESDCDHGNTDRSDDQWAYDVEEQCQYEQCLDGNCTWASKGPSLDGRVKPELIGYYDEILTTAGPEPGACGADPTAYESRFGGTSAATPQVCGMFGLFHQMWADGLFGNPHDPNKSVFENRPHAMTAKAMMINTAYRYQWYDLLPGEDANADITRDVQGWGMPNVRKLYNIAVRGGFLKIVDESTPVTLNGRQFHAAFVPDNAYSLNITLVWRDPPGNPASQIARVNDLGVSTFPDEWLGPPPKPIYHGNAGLTGAEGTNWSYEGELREEQLDAVNTVENIFIPYPQAGRWIIWVQGRNVNQDADPQTPEWDVPYALVVSVDFDCNGNGVPDSEESGPIHTLGCQSGGSSGGGSSGNPLPPELPGGCGPGSGAQ